MSEHTPGPWTVAKAVKLDNTGGQDYGVVDVDQNVIAEAFQRVGETTYRPAEANARLIAAAPTMLGALEASLDDDVSIANATVAIRAAIRKATGREPRQGGNGETS